jgi:phosphoenolpyruvate carboxykinase (GTP)
MPVRQVAAYLNINERTVLKLVSEGELPGVKIGNQWRFRKAMLDVWLDDQMLGVAPRRPEILPAPAAVGRLLDLASCFQPRHIIPDLEAKTKNGVIEELAALASHLGLIRDKTWFVGALIERENVMPSACGNGVAFLHSLHRNPEKVVKPFMVMGRSRAGVDFDALDGNPTYLFFVLGLKFRELHLPWLAKLPQMCAQPETIRTLMTATDAGTIFAALSAAEREFALPLDNRGAKRTVSIDQNQLKDSPTASRALAKWVAETAAFTKADRVYWCDGSEEERERLTDLAVSTGVLIPLNQTKRPGCYLHRSHPNDVARAEDLTLICSPSKEEAGPTNNWMAPEEAYSKLGKWFEGSMRGRTMYVVPYVLGPLGSPFAKVGVEITDSVYVALNMRIMTRMGKAALEMLGESDDFNRGLHCTLDLDPKRRLICHFPQDNTIWSAGSGYGGNALLSKKCFALRIASDLGRKEGWLAEHMLVLGVESPQGEVTYVAAAFPSACGKTNLAMLRPPASLKGWRVFTVGDDIAWLRIGADGSLWAVNPEAGYFGVAPGTNARSNPNAMQMVERDSIFTNVAMTPDGDVWWEGMGTDAPAGTVDWQGRPWQPGLGQPAAHPNSRFTTPMRNNPALSPSADYPQGVPISAIIFGGRRGSTVPLVYESFDWHHGVFVGATMGSETTAAATGKVGVIRRDPMAMLPFCGYNIGKYFSHWFAMGSRIKNPPRIFMVNWFRKDHNGSFLWPGYGENMRVLKWIVDRVQGRIGAHKTPIGLLPQVQDLDLTGLEIANEQLHETMAVKPEEWLAELNSQQEFFAGIGRTLPPELDQRREALRHALSSNSAA